MRQKGKKTSGTCKLSIFKIFWYDRQLKNFYNKINEWLAKVRRKVDLETGLKAQFRIEVIWTDEETERYQE
jgi:hypothetical protein